MIRQNFHVGASLLVGYTPPSLIFWSFFLIVPFVCNDLQWHVDRIFIRGWTNPFGGVNQLERVNRLLCFDPILQASYLSFSIEPNYDFLYIYDGPHSNSHLIGTFQDSKLPEKVESSSNIMHIAFRSDGSVSYTGFHLEYKGKCPGPLVKEFFNWICALERCSDWFLLIGTTWGRVNDDRVFIVKWFVPLTLSRPLTSLSGNARFRCYSVGGAVTYILKWYRFSGSKNEQRSDGSKM